MKKSLVTWITRLLVLVFVFSLVGTDSFRTVSYAAMPQTTGLEESEEAEAPEDEAAAETPEEPVEAPDEDLAEVPEDEPAEDAVEEVPSLEAGIVEIEKFGNVVLSISPKNMRALGYEPGDVITVTVGSETVEMPIGEDFADVDAGQALCRFLEADNSELDRVELAINMGNFASSFGIAEKVGTTEAPGYRWEWNEGFDRNTGVAIALAEKQGYADELLLHQVLSSGSLVREDYPDLTDEEYANFREIATTGMGVGTLYRSSSPINPVYNRNREADDALLMAGISTVMNMADHPDVMTQYEGYALTAYSSCNIIALNMGMDFFAEDFQAQLADGFRYMAEHDGPYLIHCNEGRNRTGFAAAILECLMGAGVEEVVEDYMLTYYNFYGVEPGSEVWQSIADANILPALERAFAVEDLYDEELDLAACAAEYLSGIGMTEDEIAALEDCLSVDYGGMADEEAEPAEVWDCSVDTGMNKDLTGIFEEATGSLLGVKYEPIALLAQQVCEEETLYCFLSRATTVYPGAEPHYTLVYVRTDGDSKVELEDIWDFSITDYLSTDEESGEADTKSVGDWDCSVDNEVSEDLETAFTEAVGGLLGVSYEPVALLAEKEENQEAEYCFLSRATVVQPDADPYYVIVSISVNADGDAQLKNICEFLTNEAPPAEPEAAEDTEEETAVPEEAETDQDPAAEAPDEESVPDDWDFSVDPEMTEAEKAVFYKAVETLLGVNYEPVAVLAELETDEGTTYCFLSRATAVYPDAEPYYALAFVQEYPDGGVELLDVWEFDVGEYADFGDFAEVF